MKETFKILSVLTITCILCAFCLALVNGAATSRIAANSKKKIEDAIATLAPEAKKIEIIPGAGAPLYKLFDARGTHIGYAFVASGDGYQGTIKILAVADVALTVLRGIEIIDSVETPGLGAKINEGFFKKQFKGLSVKEDLVCTKEEPARGNEIKAIASATISSKAVVNILNADMARMRTRVAGRLR